MNAALRLSIWLALLVVATGPIVHMIKMIRLSYDVGAYVFYTTFPLVTLLLIFGGLLDSNHPQRRPTGFLALIGAMIISSAVMTGVHEGDPFDILGNAMRLIFVFSAMFFLTNVAGAYSAFWNRHLKLLSKIFLATSLGGTLLMHLAALAGFAVYFGLQTTAAFLSFAYGIVAQRVLLVLLSLVALVGSGKRGGMLGAVVILLVYVAIAVGRVRVGRVIGMAAALSVTLVLLYVFQLLPETILGRIDFLFSDGDVDLNDITAGRVVEAAAALDRLRDNPFAWVTGFGLGSAINLDAFGGSQVSTIHFSPLGMVMIFGLPLTFLFYLAILYYAVAGFRLCRDGRVARPFVVLYLVFVAEIAFSFTAFTILQSFLLWFALAYLVVNMRPMAATPTVPARPQVPSYTVRPYGART